MLKLRKFDQDMFKLIPKNFKGGKCYTPASSEPSSKIPIGLDPKYC